MKIDEFKPRIVKPPRVRCEPKVRAQQILTAAMKLSERVGYLRITREAVAIEAGCAEGLVSHYFGTMKLLHRAIIGAAIDQENINIIAQALVHRHPRAFRAPQELRARAAASLTGD
jgi:AcrR family transcriptional regulator